MLAGLRRLAIEEAARISFAGIMTKRSLQSPPKKRLKLTQSTSRNQSGNATENYSRNGNSTRNETSMKVTYLETPVKSENDKKEYRVIKLTNELVALLISDVHSTTSQDNVEAAAAIPSESEEESDDEGSTEGESDETDEEDDEESLEDVHGDDRNEADGDDSAPPKHSKKEEKMAACGLCIDVGSFSDPTEVPGMAHFLEHMVFMGSEKYPEENAFDAFIKKRGGSDNASTDVQHTTFYFEVPEKYIASALDRFANFFIKPLLKRDAMTREREAVESEFQMALPSDFYRKEQLFGTFARNQQPSAKFSWGNLKTLRDDVTDDQLYEELHKFRERHYSANRMKLAIQARLPLDTLEEYVIRCFGSVPNNGLPPPDFSTYTNTFDTPNFRKIYKIRPVKDACLVELTWSLPPMIDYYTSKPHEYLSWIIGHEGKGSLISYLRKKMWCLEIFSGNGETGYQDNTLYTLFSITLSLTDEGHQHLEEVLNAVFSYIKLLQKEGPQKRIFDEIQQIEETNFRFAEEVPPVEYVEDLCENMHFYPPHHYINGSELYFEYNPEAIELCFSYLKPEDVNIIVFDKKFNEDEFDQVEPWFKTKYTCSDIPTEWIKNWKNATLLPDFHLPLPNVFLTTDFSLMSLPDNVPKYPVKIHSDSLCEIWYRPDDKFRLPDCYIHMYFLSPLILASPENAVQMDLYAAIVKHLLAEELYPATTAQLQYQLYASDKGIIVKVNGFNQKLSMLLQIIVKYLADCPKLLTKELFEVMKEQQIKTYYNTLVKPGKLVKDVRLSILTLVHWSPADKFVASSKVDFDQFQRFVQNVNSHLHIQCLVQGNMPEKNVIDTYNNCVEILKCQPLLPNTMPQTRVTEIPRGMHYCKVRNFNKKDVNSVVTNYYQSGLSSVKLTVIIELLVMMMEEPLFNQLRTQEQLGYNVFCLLRDTFGVLGYSVTVCTQADKYTTEHIDDRIEEFLKSFNKLLEETSEEEFNSVRAALIKLKRCADIRLKDEVDKNWYEITTGNYMFDRIEKEILALEKIELKELREWMANHTINGDNLRKLSIHVVGIANDKDNDVSDTNVSDKGTLDRISEKTPLEYIKDPKYISEKCIDNYIMNIEEYKRGLYVYPIRRCILE